MSKTIEEVAKQFADMKTTKQAGSSIERDKKALLMTQFFRYALEEVPLSERLTAEEKERVRKEYGESLSFAVYYKKKLSNSVDAVCTQHHSQSYQFYVAQIKLLERIFGKDFFKEGE